MPAEKPRVQVQEIFINKDRLQAGLKFIKKYSKTLNQVARQYQVDKYVIAAIIGVETYFGRIKVNTRLLIPYPPYLL